MSEELNMDMQEEEEIIAYPSIPYFLIEYEVGSNSRSRYYEEFHEIYRFYEVYKKGSFFITEGSNGDYTPSRLRFKKSKMIMNKEARFLFSNPPTFNINVNDVDDELGEENAILQKFIDKVLEKNNFNDKLLKGLKDCFIGKRIAIVVNFNSDGITITFLNSMEFIYKFDDSDDGQLKLFVSFHNLEDTNTINEQRWFKKKYEKERNGVFLTEEIYNGKGDLIESVTKKTKIKLDIIPAVVILNDGLTGEVKGVSELSELIDYERHYSKLANSDMDAQRKSMNPVKYTVDASNESTQNLSTSPGSYWDIQSDMDKSVELQAKVGTLEAQMNYSSPLKTTLERIENEMYSELDVPNITSEQLAGVITSGKTIQALYWGLTVRCDEKMLSWGNKLIFIVNAIIEGAKKYPGCIVKYTTEKSIPDIDYEVIVENNYPILEDIVEEKNLDISEVTEEIMSRKAYMKKWRKLSDKQADSEIQQIKYEHDLLENSYLNDYNEAEKVMAEQDDTDNDVKNEENDIEEEGLNE